MIFLRAKILYPIICIVFFSKIINSQEIKDEVNDLLKKSFGSNITINFKKYVVEKKLSSSIEKKAKQKFYDNSVYYYQINNSDKLIGYALLDNVYGKSLPITFIVLFDLSGNIKSSHIVKYREQYGGTVKNPKWNDQFIGKNSDSSFEVGKDINSISGATISVNSVTKGIYKLSILIKEIIKNGE